MTQLADDIVHLPLLPRNGINAYLLGDVLIDSGAPGHGGRLLKQLVGRPVRAHAITHAHTDHVGSTRRIATELGVPVQVGAGDADVVESGAPPAPFDGPQAALAERLTRFPGTPVTRRLQEGDVVGPGFVVVDTPGHSAGHISLWREADRTLVCGDVVNTMSLLTTRPGLQEPPQLFTVDPALNRVSIRRIAALEPALLLAGHGPPWRDPTALTAFAASLPAD